MEFKLPYLLAMREQDPKGFMAMYRAGTLDQHLQEKSREAHALLAEILRDEPKGPSGLPKNLEALHNAEAIVRDELIQFQQPEDAMRPEPPDDLPHSSKQMSKGAISGSRPAE